MCLSYYKIAHPFQQVSIRSFCRPLFDRQQKVCLPPVRRCAAGGEKRPVRGAKSGRLRRPGEPVFTGENAAVWRRRQEGQGNHLVSLPLLPRPVGTGVSAARRRHCTRHVMANIPRPGRASLASSGEPLYRRKGIPSAEGKDRRGSSPLTPSPLRVTRNEDYYTLNPIRKVVYYANRNKMPA